MFKPSHDYADLMIVFLLLWNLILSWNVYFFEDVTLLLIQQYEQTCKWNPFSFLLSTYIIHISFLPFLHFLSNEMCIYTFRRVLFQNVMFSKYIVLKGLDGFLIAAYWHHCRRGGGDKIFALCACLCAN